MEALKRALGIAPRAGDPQQEGEDSMTQRGTKAGGAEEQEPGNSGSDLGNFWLEDSEGESDGEVEQHPSSTSEDEEQQPANQRGRPPKAQAAAAAGQAPAKPRGRPPKKAAATQQQQEAPPNVPVAATTGAAGKRKRRAGPAEQQHVAPPQQQPQEEKREQEEQQGEGGPRRSKRGKTAGGSSATAAASTQSQQEEEEGAAEEGAPQQQLKGRPRSAAPPAGGPVTRTRAAPAAPPRPAAAAAGRQQRGVSPPAPQQQRSQTPMAAAAAALEMSAPPASASPPGSPRAAAVAPAAAQPLQPGTCVAAAQPQAAAPARQAAALAAEVQREGPAYAACSLLTARLANPAGTAAASMELRPSLQHAYESLRRNLDNTVELGHNNSLLVLGPRGCGKTLVVERALAATLQRWNGDRPAADPLVGVVRLTGWAHADERTAFREVARQLCGSFRYSFSRGASVGENIDFLRGMLQALSRADKACIFVLDDFDLFAKRAKQALLYNLLDALQTSGMQAAVVGLTCRQDVVEMLEKRVKSRFSHRKVELGLPTSVLPIPPPPRGAEVPAPFLAGASLDCPKDCMINVLKAMLTLPADFPDAHFAQRFNLSVEAACGSEAVHAGLQRYIHAHPSLRNVAGLAAGAAAAASRSREQLLSSRALLAALQRAEARSRQAVQAVSDLSVLELVLVVALHRAASRARGDAPINFEAAHHEFKRYAGAGDHVDVYSRAAAAKAFDHLLTQGLVCYADARGQARAAGARQYAPVHLQLRREEVVAGMAVHWNCPTALREWLTKEGGLGTNATMH